MDLDEFIVKIKSYEDSEINRCEVMDLIIDNHDEWSLAFIALLMRSPKKYVEKYYLLQKLEVWGHKKGRIHEMLDYWGKQILRALMDVIKTGFY